MKTLIPAAKKFWAEISVWAKVVSIASLLSFVVVVIGGIFSTVQESRDRQHYRSLIRANTEAVETICRNEPRLCREIPLSENSP